MTNRKSLSRFWLVHAISYVVWWSKKLKEIPCWLSGFKNHYHLFKWRKDGKMKIFTQAEVACCSGVRKPWIVNLWENKCSWWNLMWGLLIPQEPQGFNWAFQWEFAEYLLPRKILLCLARNHNIVKDSKSVRQHWKSSSHIRNQLRR